VKQTRVRLALLAVIALIALPALLPATASAQSFKLGTGKVSVSLNPFYLIFLTGGYPMYPVAPAAMAFDAPGTRLALPVKGGIWNAGLHPHGTFVLKGGFEFIHYSGSRTRDPQHSGMACRRGHDRRLDRPHKRDPHPYPR